VTSFVFCEILLSIILIEFTHDIVVVFTRSLMKIENSL